MGFEILLKMAFKMGNGRESSLWQE